MTDSYDLAIIGMGSGGMVAAEFAAGLGLSVVVLERDRVGGDCLWTGCVPSKALLASAKAAHTMRHGSDYGLPSIDVEVDTGEVWRRIRRIQADIAATDDDPARFAELGIHLVTGDATVTGPHEVTVDGDRTIDARFILLCTGSRPTRPDIAGLDDIDPLTSETIFELDRPPASLVFIGGGPIAVELAQALNRLGVITTILQRAPGILPRDEPVLADRLARVLGAEGVDIVTGVEVRATRRTPDGRCSIEGQQWGESRTWEADAAFLATGRTPNTEGLGLEALDIEVTPRGVGVDDRLRTNVASIYAAGDVAGRHHFTHSAGYEAVRAVRDMFFPGKGRADAMVPWCTFTDPELAHAGLTVTEAEAEHGASAIRVWRQDLDHNDRARTDGATAGSVMLITAKDRLVGAHVLAPAAGETIHELALAIHAGTRLSALGGLVHVYPTTATAVHQLAGEAAFEKAGRYRWLMRRSKR